MTDSDLINPSMFPIKSWELDLDAIHASASGVKSIGTGVLAATEQAKTSWAGLSGPDVFVTPEHDAVLAIMDPAVQKASAMQEVTGRVGSALSAYAFALGSIKPLLADLELRAWIFRREAQAGYEVSNWDARGFFGNFSTGIDGSPTPMADASETTTIAWQEHGPAVEKNAQLLAEFQQILADVSAAATTCANTIQSELTGYCAAPYMPVTVEILEANPEFSTWGSAVTEDRNCTESVGHGFGNFFTGMITGAGTLAGIDPETGEWWQGDVAWPAWLGVGDFVLSTVLVINPMLILPTWGPGPKGPVSDFLRDRYTTAATAWGGLIGWDHQAALAGANGWHKWEEDGVATLTESAANIGSFFIPVAGWAGGGAKLVLSGTRVGALTFKVLTNLGELVISGGSHLLAGTVKIVDLTAIGIKGGWHGLVDILKDLAPKRTPVPDGAIPDTIPARVIPETTTPPKIPVTKDLFPDPAPRVPVRPGDLPDVPGDGPTAPGPGEGPGGKPDGDSGETPGNHGGSDGLTPGGGAGGTTPSWNFHDPQVQELATSLAEAASAKNIPGYDPTAGLGWEKFLTEHFNGFSVDGVPRWKWPADPPHTNGFNNGVSTPAVAPESGIIERIAFIDSNGEPVNGRFASPPGSQFESLSLPPDRLGVTTSTVRYHVLRELPPEVRMGEIAPGFGQPGLGTQYFFPGGIERYVLEEFLRVDR